MINGIINVYKEKGFTSHDVVAKLRGILKQKKIGHTGTLDPDATGVLPVCLGKATKVVDLLTDRDKTYQAELLLGLVTDTQDTSGITLRESEVTVEKEQVEEVIYSFLGDSMQIPPMYSALKVNGKKLYELARQGIEVERAPRPICISQIKIVEWNLSVVKIEFTCSKGTYIRTLCHDIGEKLGCGGCMQSLIRTRVGEFHLEDALTLSEIEEIRNQDNIQALYKPVESLFSNLKSFLVKEEFHKLLYNGNPMKLDFLQEEISEEEQHSFEESQESVRIFDANHQFIGIYTWNQEKEQFKPVKLFIE